MIVDVECRNCKKMIVNRTSRSRLHEECKDILKKEKKKIKNDDFYLNKKITKIVKTLNDGTISLDSYKYDDLFKLIPPYFKDYVIKSHFENLKQD